MSPLLALEITVLSLAVAVSLIFAIWRICGDVRKIREHFDRVDRLAAQKLGYSPRPTPAMRDTVALSLAILFGSTAAQAQPAPVYLDGAAYVVPGQTRTLADVARERKLGKRPAGDGTLSVSGSSTGTTAAALSNIKVQIKDTEAASAAEQRMARALHDASWVNKNIHYNWDIIQGAQSEWDAAAENCRKTPGCTPFYRK